MINSNRIFREISCEYEAVKKREQRFSAHCYDDHLTPTPLPSNRPATGLATTWTTANKLPSRKPSTGFEFGLSSSVSISEYLNSNSDVQRLRKRPLVFSTTVVWMPVQLPTTLTQYSRTSTSIVFNNDDFTRSLANDGGCANGNMTELSSTSEDDDATWAYQRIRDIYILHFATLPLHHRRRAKSNIRRLQRDLSAHVF